MFLHHLTLCAPLFALVFLGWALGRIHFFPDGTEKALSAFTFRLLMPALLFHLMSGLSEMPPVDPKVLAAYFGACFLLFFLGRALWMRRLSSGAAGATVLAMGAIFGNTVQLGVPIVEVSLGEAAMPTISVLIIFNILLLWTLAIASVEFGRTEGPVDAARIARSTLRVFKNPIVIGILLGCGWGMTGIELPYVLERTVSYVAAGTTPIALIVVGMGLARHSFTASLGKGLAVTCAKLVAMPAIVWLFCRALGLGEIETQATTVLAALPVAINTYIMAGEFDAEEGGVSNAILLSTLCSAVLVPFVLTLLGAGEAAV